jgi:hypothetical protein
MNLEEIAIQLNLLAAQNEELRKELQIKTQEITDVRNQSQRVANAISRQMNSPVSKEPKCCEPPIYDGTNDAIEFMSKVKIVFSLQSSRFDSELKKISYTATFLKGSV